ncbi:unnamed protein product [Sphagnum balticum]
MHQATLQHRKNPITQEYESHMYRKDTWICYSCQEICNCEKCKRSELASLEKKNSKRKSGNGPSVSQSMSKQNAEESLEHSLSNSAQNNKVAEPVAAVSQGPLEIITIEPRKKQFKEFRLMGEDELAKLPPYLRKIIERKHMFYNFVLQQSTKPNEKG